MSGYKYPCTNILVYNCPSVQMSGVQISEYKCPGVQVSVHLWTPSLPKIFEHLKIELFEGILIYC